MASKEDQITTNTNTDEAKSGGTEAAKAAASFPGDTQKDASRQFTPEEIKNVAILDEAFGFKKDKGSKPSQSDIDAASKFVDSLPDNEKVELVFQYLVGEFLQSLTKDAKQDKDKDEDSKNDAADISTYCKNSIQQAIDNGKTIKATSAGQSIQFQTEIGKPGSQGIELKLNEFNNVDCAINEDTLTSDAQSQVQLGNIILVESGALVKDVEDYYWPPSEYGSLTNPQTNGPYKCLPNRGGSNLLSIVGLASAGAMGYGNPNADISDPSGYGGIQNVILSLRCLTVENGNTINEYVIEPSINDGAIHDKSKFESNAANSGVTLIQDSDTFNNWVTSMGTYGIITHVYVKMVDAHYLIQNRACIPITQFALQYELLSTSSSIVKFEMYFVPYTKFDDTSGTCVYNAFFKAPADAVVDTPETIEKYGGVTRASDPTTAKIASCAIVLLSKIPSLSGLVPLALDLGLLGTCTSKPLTMSCVEALNFQTGNEISTNTIGMAFPIENAMNVVKNYGEFIINELNNKKYYVTSPVALRFAKKSNGSASAAGDYAIAWLEQPVVTGTENTNNILNDIFYDYYIASVQGYKINWGLYFPLTNVDGNELKKVCWKNVNNYDVSETGFKAMYKKFNSGKMFCNQFTVASGLDD